MKMDKTSGIMSNLPYTFLSVNVFLGEVVRCYENKRFLLLCIIWILYCSSYRIKNVVKVGDNMIDQMAKVVHIL